MTDRDDNNLFQLGGGAPGTGFEDLTPDEDLEAGDPAEQGANADEERAKKQRLGKIGAMAAGGLMVLGFSYFAYSKLSRNDAPVGTGIPPVAAQAAQAPAAPYNPYSAPSPQSDPSQALPEAKISVGPNSVVISTPQAGDTAAPAARPNDVPPAPQQPSPPGMAASPAIVAPAIPSTEPRFEAVEKKSELLSEKLDLLSDRLAKLESQISDLAGKMEKATKVAAQPTGEKKAVAVAPKPAPEKTKSAAAAESPAKASVPNHSIQSIIVGQAWIVDRLGQVHVVREGDTLPLTGAKIVKIDPSKGEVATSKGVIRGE